MSPRSGDRLASGVGLVIGLAVVAVAVLGWRFPGGATGTLPASATISVASTGELIVTPEGTLVSAPKLMPGTQPGEGSFKVRNITGSTLSIQVKATASHPDLNPLLWVEVDAGGVLLYRGTLGDLSAWTSTSFSLASARGTHVTLKAWLPADSPAGWQGRVVAATLQFRATVMG